MATKTVGGKPDQALTAVGELKAQLAEPGAAVAVANATGKIRSRSAPKKSPAREKASERKPARKTAGKHRQRGLN